MNMGLEDRLKYQTAQSAQMDTSQLQGLDASKFGKSPDDIFADMQKHTEIQAAARDVLKKKPTVVTSDASPDHMIVDDDSATSSKGKAKEGTPQQDTNNSAGPSVLTPISTEPSKQRIILNRSQRFRIYAPTSVFQAPNFAQIKKALQTAFRNLPSLTGIYEKKSKKTKILSFILSLLNFSQKKMVMLPSLLTSQALNPNFR